MSTRTPEDILKDNAIIRFKQALTPNIIRQLSQIKQFALQNNLTTFNCFCFREENTTDNPESIKIIRRSIKQPFMDTPYTISPGINPSLIDQCFVPNMMHLCLVYKEHFYSLSIASEPHQTTAIERTILSIFPVSDYARTFLTIKSTEENYIVLLANTYAGELYCISRKSGGKPTLFIR